MIYVYFNISIIILKWMHTRYVDITSYIVKPKELSGFQESTEAVWRIHLHKGMNGDIREEDGLSPAWNSHSDTGPKRSTNHLKYNSYEVEYSGQKHRLWSRLPESSAYSIT